MSCARDLNFASITLLNAILTIDFSISILLKYITFTITEIVAILSQLKKNTSLVKLFIALLLPSVTLRQLYGELCNMRTDLRSLELVS